MSHRFPITSRVATLLLASLLFIVCVGSSVPAAAQSAGVGSGVDLNSADAATLARELLGIGESRARAIVEHRRRHGPFRSVDELALVRGIGPKTVERNRARLRVGGGSVGGSGTGMGSVGTGSSGARVSRPSPPGPSRPQEEGPIIIEGLPREGG